MPTVFDNNERRAAHRAGISNGFNKRQIAAAYSSALDSGEFNVLRSQLPTIAGAALTSGTAYWVFLGRAAKQVTVNRVRCFASALGSGAQTAEVAIATSTDAPNGAAKTLTVVAVNATLDDLTSGAGVKGNTVDFGYVVDPGTYVWLGIRTALATTQPTVYGHTFDCNGELLSTAAAGVLAVGTSYTGALITAAVAWQAPALFATVTT